MQRYLVRGAGEAERDPTAQHVQIVCGHVVPVPSGRLRHGLESANVFGADAATGHGGEPEVAILGVLAQTLSVPGRHLRAHVSKRRQRLRELAGSVVARRTFVVMHASLSLCAYPLTAPAVSPAMNHF